MGEDIEKTDKLGMRMIYEDIFPYQIAPLSLLIVCMFNHKATVIIFTHVQWVLSNI